MNNFDAVFTVVQRHCSKQKILTSTGQLQQVAVDAGVPIDSLPFYLECLNDLGLIDYSANGKKISLTTKGETTTFVFTEILSVN